MQGTDSGHAGIGDCVLAESLKEAAYRRLPGDKRGSHLQVQECRECGRKRAHVLDGHRGEPLSSRRFGREETEAILAWYDVE